MTVKGMLSFDPSPEFGFAQQHHRHIRKEPVRPRRLPGRGRRLQAPEDQAPELGGGVGGGDAKLQGERRERVDERGDRGIETRRRVGWSACCRAVGLFPSTRRLCVVQILSKLLCSMIYCSLGYGDLRACAMAGPCTRARILGEDLPHHVIECLVFRIRCLAYGVVVCLKAGVEVQLMPAYCATPRQSRPGMRSKGAISICSGSTSHQAFRHGRIPRGPRKMPHRRAPAGIQRAR
jgi:hypothetical protein